MLITVNVENFRIYVGFFASDSNALVAKFQVAADPRKTADEYSSLFCSIMREKQIPIGDCCDAILSSVVPQLTETIKEAIFSVTGKDPVMVGPGLKTGFSLRIDTPSEVGGDLVADVAAALYEMRAENKMQPAVIWHLGRVSTVCAINRSGDFIGCAIVPGMGMSMEMLHGQTAQLPSVGATKIGKSIGKNSQDAVLSGVICGHALMLDGFLERFSREMKCSPEELACFATGDEVKYLEGICKTNFLYRENMTLNGLRILFENSKKESVK